MTEEASIGQCPFCKKGTMTEQKQPLFIYWHRARRGYWRSKLKPIECDGCGIIVFKRIEDKKKAWQE